MPEGRSLNKPLSVRLQPLGKKREFLEVANRRGEVASDITNRLIDFWLKVPGAELPPGPWSDAEE